MKKFTYISILSLLTAVFVLTGAQTANAFFSTNESSQSSAAASSLDIALSSSYDDKEALTTLELSAGSLDASYTADGAVSGGASFCNDLRVTVEQGGTQAFSGKPEDFTASGALAITGEQDNFTYTFSTNAVNKSYAGETCAVSFEFKANQENHNYGEGFYDREEAVFVLSGADFGNTSNTLGQENGVVLNEVLPNPEGTDSRDGLQGEWVELYNNGDQDRDLTGWYIEDKAGNTQTVATSTTWEEQTTIGLSGNGNEWVVLFMNGAVLNNTGDTVTLYDTDGNEKDSYTFGKKANDDDSDSNETGGESNGTTTTSQTTMLEGKSDARIPDGTGDWIDPVPTPGAENTLDQPEDMLTLQTDVMGTSTTATSTDETQKTASSTSASSTDEVATSSDNDLVDDTQATSSATSTASSTDDQKDDSDDDYTATSSDSIESEEKATSSDDNMINSDSETNSDIEDDDKDSGDISITEQTTEQENGEIQNEPIESEEKTKEEKESVLEEDDQPRDSDPDDVSNPKQVSSADEESSADESIVETVNDDGSSDANSTEKENE